MAVNKSKDITNKQINQDSQDKMSARNGVHFYMIVAFSLVLPVLIVCFVMYEQKVVTAFLALVVAVILGFLVRAFWRAKRQLDGFEEALSHLEDTESDHEISVMGGMVSLRIEQNTKRLPEPPDAVNNERAGSHSGRNS